MYGTESVDLQNASNYASQLRRLHPRRPFISQTAYVGLAPSHVLEGDIICIFLGGKGVYLLRPQPEVGTYIVVGEAYVHGIMYGEFMKSDLQIQLFTLV
jgi:hypothetical protein